MARHSPGAKGKWRIARRPHALDRQGLGARENGGRWNAPGTSVISAGRTVGIAARETFVRLAGAVPPALVLVRVELPEGGSWEEPAPGDLPPAWNAIPPVPATMRLGTTWAHENRSLVLDASSVLASEERIGVVNPDHAEFPGTTMAIEREFRYGPRMFHRRLPSARVRVMGQEDGAVAARVTGSGAPPLLQEEGDHQAPSLAASGACAMIGP